MQSPQRRIQEWFDCLPQEFQQHLAVLMIATLPHVDMAGQCSREQAIGALHQWLSQTNGHPSGELGNALAFQAVVRFLTSTKLTKNGTPETSILLGSNQVEAPFANTDMESVDAMLACVRETQRMWLVIAASWRQLEISCLTTTKIEHWLMSQQKAAGKFRN